jgi:hypothetical protein
MGIDDMSGKCDPVLTNAEVRADWSSDYPEDSQLAEGDLAWPCGYIAKYHFTDRFSLQSVE